MFAQGSGSLTLPPPHVILLKRVSRPRLLSCSPPSGVPGAGSLLLRVGAAPGTPRQHSARGSGEIRTDALN